MSGTLKRVIIIFTAVLALTLLFLVYAYNNIHVWESTSVKEPSCMTEGVTVSACRYCGKVKMEMTAAALGHDFTDIKNNIVNETKYSVCTRCGAIGKAGTYEPPENVRRFYLKGDPKTIIVDIDVDYFDYDGKESTAFAEIQLDSKTFIAYDNSKRDYVMRFYNNKAEKTPVTFDLGQGIGNVYSATLKSEYIDKSCIRNLLCSSLYEKAVENREDVDENLAALPHKGADYGEPVLFYTNGNFKGVYNICLGSDNGFFGLTDKKKQANVYVYPFFGETDLKVNSSDERTEGCLVVFPTEREDKAWAQESLAAVYDFAVRSDIPTFADSIGKYIDIDAAIDYLVFAMTFGLDDNYDKFANWVTFDGKKWIPCLYNMTASLGINKMGNTVASDECVTPYYSDGILTLDVETELWKKLCAAFPEKIAERYKELRSTVLSDESFENGVTEQIDKIFDILYEAELDEYPKKNMMNGAGDKDGIVSWFGERTKLLDELLSAN